MFHRILSFLRSFSKERDGPRAPGETLPGALAALEARLQTHYCDMETRLTDRLAEMQRENQLLLGQLSLPPAELWRDGPPPRAREPGQRVFSHSTLCRQASFETAYFPYWSDRLGFEVQYLRKLWEFVFICQALFERGLLKPGMKGLGFGVGGEPLSAFFASEGCFITATDMGPTAAAETGWAQSEQHATGKKTLRFPELCPDHVFDANVQFRACNMNEIPGDLTGYDFCWSACALEHLGSIEHGLAFIERSLECLKPGGFAIHTTEYNLSSNAETVAQGGTVLFRQQDMEELARRMAAKGHIMAPLDLDPGYGQVDRYIDVPPYRNWPHLKLALQGYACTSIGTIIQKAS